MAADSVETLFEALRAECPRELWSRGVELARADAVRGEQAQGGEIALRVTTRGGLICPVVILVPEDASWECDCGSREDVCEHAVAAVIALRRARREGQELPRGDAGSGRVGYRLARHGGELLFERVVVGPQGEEPLATTLTALATGKVSGRRSPRAAPISRPRARSVRCGAAHCRAACGRRCSRRWRAPRT